VTRVLSHDSRICGRRPYEAETPENTRWSIYKNYVNDREILKSGGLSKPISKSWFFVWSCIKKTFELAYCVEFESKLIGFIGLYNLQLGKSAEMALVIFGANNRRMGYGTGAFHILAQTLRRCNFIEKIVVKVREDNDASLSFWTGLGFADVHSLDRIKVMSLDFVNTSSYRNFP